MRILVAIAQVPFLRRATETLAEDLSAAFRQRGDSAEIVRVPFSSATPERLLDHMVATRLMDWTGTEASVGDVLVALEFPAYLIPHPRKILWLAHDRPDLDAEAGIEAPAPTAALEAALEVRRRMDLKYLPEMQRRFAASAGVAASLKSRCGLDATPLYAPAHVLDELAWQRPEGYFLVPPGLSPSRVELALETLAAAAAPIRLRICGRFDREIAARLRETAARLGLAERVEWLGEQPEAAIARLYGASFSVFYPALEDPSSRVSLHAGLASKALIVCADSGAPAELVGHETCGAVVAAEPAALAAALDDLWTHPERTSAWGRAGRKAARSPDFTWDHVLGELLRPGIVGVAAGVGR